VKKVKGFPVLKIGSMVLPVQLGPSSTLRQKGDQGLVLSEQLKVSLYRR
jgi:hypothetical protein